MPLQDYYNLGGDEDPLYPAWDRPAYEPENSPEILAQTFTPILKYNIESVKIKGYVDTRYDEGDVTLAIYATSGGIPTGSAMVSKVVEYASLPTAWDWVEFVFASSIELTSGVMYAIVVSIELSDGGASCIFHWDLDTGGSGGGYAGGRQWVKLGTNPWDYWYLTGDFLFETYGESVDPIMSGDIESSGEMASSLAVLSSLSGGIGIVGTVVAEFSASMELVGAVEADCSVNASLWRPPRPPHINRFIIAAQKNKLYYGQI